VLADGADDLEVDAAGVRDAAEEASARLKRANRVRKSLTNVTNSAETAREEFDEIILDVERCIARIEGLVAAAAANDQHT
jgi:spermidine synthase